MTRTCAGMRCSAWWDSAACWIRTEIYIKEQSLEDCAHCSGQLTIAVLVVPTNEKLAIIRDCGHVLARKVEFLMRSLSVLFTLLGG